MSALGKSIRDGGLTGGVTLVVTGLLVRAGLGYEEAAGGGVLAGAIFARGYRALRKRWGWLGAFDPAGGSNG